MYAVGHGVEDEQQSGKQQEAKHGFVAEVRVFYNGYEDDKREEQERCQHEVHELIREDHLDVVGDETVEE